MSEKNDNNSNPPDDNDPPDPNNDASKDKDDLVRTKSMEAAANAAARGVIASPKKPADQDKMGLRSKSMEESANAAARGETYTRPASPTKGKKALRNSNNPKPGAYAVTANDDGNTDDVEVQEPPLPAVSEVNSYAKDNKKGFQNSMVQQPGAYAVKTPASSSAAGGGKKGYAPSPPRKGPRSTVNTVPQTHNHDVAEPDFHGTVTASSTEPTTEQHQNDESTASTDDTKNDKKKLRKTIGPVTVIGPGGTRTEINEQEKDTISKNNATGYAGYSPAPIQQSVEEPDIEKRSVLKEEPPPSAIPPDVYVGGRSPAFGDETVATDGFDDESQITASRPLSSRERVHGGEVLPEASNVDEHAKWSVGFLETPQRKCVALVVLLCIVGIVVGVAVGVSSSSSGGGDGPVTKETTTTTTTTTTQPPAVDITPCITLDPSFTASENFLNIRSFLIDESISEESEMDGANTPQRRALCWISEVDTISQNEEVKTSQRYILSVLFYELGAEGSSFVEESNWVDRFTSECEWEGVDCDGDGRVTVIELRDEDLEGEIPKEVAGLGGLSVFDLSFNRKITGSLPEEFRNLGSLTIINLEGDKLSGPLPTFLGELTSLEKIFFQNNDFDGLIPSEYGNLVNLVEFQVDANNLVGNPGDIVKKWTKLKLLHLDMNSFNGTILDDLKSLSSLEDITVESNDFSGTLPSELGEIASLLRIRVSSNDMYGALPTEYGQLTSLHTFIITNNDFNSTLPIEYGGMTDLRNLHIDRNDITGEVLSDHPVCRLALLREFYATEGDDFKCECCTG